MFTNVPDAVAALPLHLQGYNGPKEVDTYDPEAETNYQRARAGWAPVDPNAHAKRQAEKAATMSPSEAAGAVAAYPSLATTASWDTAHTEQGI